MFSKPFIFLTVLLSGLGAVVQGSPLERRAWPRGDVTCGTQVYTLAKVKSAVAAGWNQVGNPIGSNSYPHTFNNREGLSMWCTGKRSFQEWPIISSGTYSGGSPGADRVVFSSDDGTYCAVITHTGASGNNFVSCAGD